ncbi:MAG: DUF2249 domain-containing protein, partial [Rhodanobacteraceae bacterium]
MQTAVHRIDVRSLPPSRRHARILDAFDALGGSQTLVVVTDHDARPLHIEFERFRTARYVWVQRRLGERRWEVTLRKISPGPDAAKFTLVRSPVFAQASAATLAALEPLGRRATIKRDRAVVEQGVSWPYVGVVESGIV